jgi:hypothetical protein
MINSSLKFKKLLLLKIILLLFFSTNAQAQKSDVNYFDFYQEKVKNFCINFHTKDPDDVARLSNMGVTIKDVCSCAENEMKYFMSKDNAERFHKALTATQANKTNQNNSEDTMVVADWSKRTLNSMLACTIKLIDKK